VQDVFYSQSFKHGDIGPILHDSEREAGVNGPAIHRHRAGAALAIVRALFRIGEVEMIEKRIELGRPTAPALVTLCCPLTLSATETPVVAPGQSLSAAVVACVMSKPFSVTGILIVGTKWFFLF
jgi:hypothetical protein